MHSARTAQMTQGLPRGLDKQSQGKTVHFGLWDSEARLSRLQLTVVVSMALHIEDGRVHVDEESDSKFFKVVIDDEAEALANVINDPSFADLLNGQVLSTDSELVVSRSAVVVTSQRSAGVNSTRRKPFTNL